MSAIVATFERHGGPASSDLASGMLATMRHRGPDGTAIRLLGSVALGQAALWTTPEDAGAVPPVANAAGNSWIVADARIDNRDEILAECVNAAERVADDPGRASRVLSDAEVVLLAYDRWGAACPARLLGDFAFVIWDSARRELFAARDHLGVKPLFYRCTHDKFRCATEMRALAAEHSFVRRADWTSLALFLCEAYTENEQTLYAGVMALPGGHRLHVSRSACTVDRYWHPNRIDQWRGASDACYAERFHDAFSKAVSVRLRTRGPVGIQVSGGQDSSSVAVEAARLQVAGQTGPAQPTLVRLAFPGLACDETRYSDAVASTTGFPMLTVSALEDDRPFSPYLEPEHPDLYFLPTTACLLPLVEASVARGIRTTLTGHGGDQLLTESGLATSTDLRRGRFASAARSAGLWRAPLSFAAWKRLARAAFLAGPHPLVVAYARHRLPRALPPVPWLSRRAWRAVVDRTYDVRRAFDAPASPDAAARAQWDALDGRFVKYTLGQWDRVAARVGAEHRHAFFDRRLVDLALSMPEEQRAVAGMDKAKPVLRRAMRGLLPEVILTRRDSAAYDCYTAVALERSQHVMSDLLNGSLLHETGLIDRDVARRFLSDRSSWELFGTHLMNLAALELWLRTVQS